MTRKIAISHENPGSSRPFIGCNQRNEPGKQQFHREILAGVGHSPVISSQTNREKAILQLYPGRNSYFIYCVVARYTSLELISTITEPSHQALLLYFPCIFHASSTHLPLQKCFKNTHLTHASSPSKSVLIFFHLRIIMYAWCQSRN